MTIFAGIDGGQSSTIALLVDEGGRELGRGLGPPADTARAEMDLARQADALDVAIDAALAAASLAPETRIHALVAGISGHDPGSPTPRVRDRVATTHFVHDAEIAHAGALGGAPGIVVVAGTGSVALGTADGCGFVRAGGWGYYFGDEGSAVAIARNALACAMRRSDRGERSRLEHLALRAFGAEHLRELQRAFATGRLDRPALAGFAIDVLACATSDGDPDAIAIRDRGAADLTDLVATVDARLAAAPERIVSYAGGMFRDAPFAAAFSDSVAARLPHATVRPPAGDGACGAARMARKMGGA